MNQHKQKSGAQALWLSALTAEAGRCILTGGGVSARGLILQGLPVALGISLAAALFRVCFLVHLLRRLLGLVWNGRRQEVQG